MTDDPLNPDDVTLREAIDWLRPRAEDGGEVCPCCKRFAKVYKRKIHAGMARALIVMYGAGGTDWLHKPTVLRGLGAAARDESLLRYWGLTEPDLTERDDGSRRNGWWRVTEDGARYVRGQRLVPKYAVVYGARFLGLEGELLSIHDALGTNFDYTELMSA